MHVLSFSYHGWLVGITSLVNFVIHLALQFGNERTAEICNINFEG